MHHHARRISQGLAIILIIRARDPRHIVRTVNFDTQREIKNVAARVGSAGGGGGTGVARAVLILRPRRT